MKRYFLIAAALALLLWLFYEVYVYILPSDEERLIDALHLHNRGNIDESIKAFEAVQDGELSIDRVYWRMMLARNLTRRNKGDDRTTGIQTYKDIAINTSVFPNQRALSLSVLLDRYNGTRDTDALKNIFLGEPLAKFLINDDYDLAIRKSYEYANSIRPISILEYQAGMWYAQKLREGNISQEDKEKYIKELQVILERGEALEPDIEKYSSIPHFVSWTYDIKALDLAALAEATDKNYKKAEDTFKRALSIETGFSAYTEWLNHNLRLRYYYAAFLASTEGKNRLADIDNLLGLFWDIPDGFENYPFSIYEYWENVAKEPKDSLPKKDMLKLVEVSPVFREYLASRRIEF